MMARPKQPKRSPARDPVFTDAALKMLAEGKTLTDASRELGVPRKTLLDCLTATPELNAKYARAREAGHDVLAEELEQLAQTPLPMLPSGGIDSAAVQQLRLRIDTRKWLLARLASHKYGDRVTNEHVSPSGGPVEHVHRIELVPLGKWPGTDK